MKRVSVIGATGYVGAEIVRLLSQHPYFEISKLTSRSFEGSSFSEIYPSLLGKVDQTLVNLDIDEVCSTSDIVVTALPHGISSKTVPLLLDKGVKVLDHSGDYRFRDITSYLKAYMIDHSSPEYLDEAIYGLPELYRDGIAQSALVADPGCYPTCSILAAAPLLANNLISLDNIVINGASGISGAGRNGKLDYSFCEAAGSMKPYTPVGHRHTVEIEQEFSFLAEHKIKVTFTPHLIPMKRGMLCTIYANMIDPLLSDEDIETAYIDAYQSEYFIRYLGNKCMPQTKSVAGSNYAHISFAINRETSKILAFCAIDNLGKGSASQAIQCLNIMADLEEDAGLSAPALYI